MLTNIKNKCVTRRINFYFVELMRNSQIFPPKVFYFQYDHRFLFSREIRSIRKIRQQKRIKFGLPGYIWVVIYQDAYKQKII